MTLHSPPGALLVTLLLACSGSGPVDISTDGGVDAGVDAATDAGLPPRSGFEAPTGCGAAPLVFDGALCGAEGDPCVVLREEIVTGPGEGNRNGRPSIAIETSGRVHISYSDASNGYRGQHASAEADGAFEVGPTGLRTAVGALAVDSEGGLFLASNDGATNMQFYTRQPDETWLEFGALDDANIAPGRLFVDEAGCVHGGGSPTFRARATVHTWKDGEPISAPAGRDRNHLRPSAFALSPLGTPHFVWSEPLAPNRLLEILWADGADVRIVETDISSRDDNHKLELGVDSSETPHILYNRSGLETRMLYASPGTDGEFINTVIESSDFVGCNPTPGPEVSGEACAYEVDFFVPIGVFVSGASVRLAYLRIKEEASLEPQCMLPSGPCTWDGERVHTTDLILTTMSDEGPIRTVLPTNLGDARGTGVVASDGSMHFAFYDTGDSLHYLHVGVDANE